MGKSKSTERREVELSAERLKELRIGIHVTPDPLADLVACRR